jgi:hypothetical protein
MAAYDLTGRLVTTENHGVDSSILSPATTDPLHLVSHRARIARAVDWQADPRRLLLEITEGE